MLEDIITGEDDPERLASLALGHLRVKIPQLDGTVTGTENPNLGGQYADETLTGTFLVNSQKSTI